MYGFINLSCIQPNRIVVNWFFYINFKIVYGCITHYKIKFHNFSERLNYRQKIILFNQLF